MYRRWQKWCRQTIHSSSSRRRSDSTHTHQRQEAGKRIEGLSTARLKYLDSKAGKDYCFVGWRLRNFIQDQFPDSASSPFSFRSMTSSRTSISMRTELKVASNCRDHEHSQFSPRRTGVNATSTQPSADDAKRSASVPASIPSEVPLVILRSIGDLGDLSQNWRDTRTTCRPG